MIRFLTILSFCVFAVAQEPSTAPRAPAPPSAPVAKPALNLNDSDNARKARTLLDQTITALGGQAYLAMQNRAEEGRLYSLYHGGSRGTGVQYRYFNRFPDQDRLEILGRGNVFIPLPLFGSVDVIVVGRQKKSAADLVVIHNGDKGYETTNKGTAPQDKEDLQAYLRRRQHSLEQLLRKWINDPNMQFFYEGLAIIDGKPTDQVSVLSNRDDSITVYLDQNTHLPLKNTFTWRDPKDKQKNTEEEVYDNYRLVQGIMTPHSITRFFNGEATQQRFINTARFNLQLPETTFQAEVTYDPLAPPEKKK